MLTRRDFVAKLAVAGAALGAFSMARGAVLPVEASAALGRVRREVVPFCEVVSFHMDQPYIDATGTAMPYRPPQGARSAAAVAHLSEEAFRRMQCCA
ncbi:MAG: twin-arginine translocation signal domain-containing protein [Candidatus Acidiferrales bacterium]|jgi:hypothetical protein